MKLQMEWGLEVVWIGSIQEAWVGLSGLVPWIGMSVIPGTGAGREQWDDLAL